MTNVAVIGAGLIGRAWSIVFARAGFQVALWDKFPAQVQLALDFIADRLPELRQAGLLVDEPAVVLGRIRPMQSMWEAVRHAVHIQENGPEKVPEKQALFAELDRAAKPDAVLASSTSGIPASAFTEGLNGRARCLVAHPVNPPYLVPLVEICPAPWTSDAAVAQARDLMHRAGQVPVTVKKELDGFALNRLQGALLAEAFRLLDADAISSADLDALVKHGLGLRWSFMGPFETIEMNAPGGIPDYCARFSKTMSGLAARPFAPDLFEPANVARIMASWGRTPTPDDVAKKSRWRDERLAALQAHKKAQSGYED